MSRMNSNHRLVDAVVVGAGIVGHCAAAALAENGLHVALLDAGLPGEGTSSSSFNWINATSKTNDQTYFSLNAAGLACYRAQGDEWGDQQIGLKRSGMIEWAHPGVAEKLEEIRQSATRLKEWSYPVEWLDKQQLEEAEPGVLFERNAEGYLAPEDCWLDVERYLDFLRNKIMQAGSALFDNCAALKLIATDEGVVQGIETGAGRFVCHHVVVATGPATPEVLSRLTDYEGYASRFPMHKAPGLLLSTPACDDSQIRRILYTPDSSGFHMRESGNGRLLAGADDTDGLLSEPVSENDALVPAQKLLERIHRFLSTNRQIDFERCKWSVGIRAVPVDGRSIAGPVLGAEGLHMILTHSGITLAPALAELVANSIVSGRASEGLEPYLLDRFDTVV